MTDDALGAPEPDSAADRFFALSLDLLCIAGLDGYFRRVNPAWERTLGFATAELMARPIMELIHPDDRARTRAIGPALKGGEDVAHFDNRFRCKDGSYRLISWTCSAVRPGDDCYYGVGRDVTAARRADEQLRQKTLEMEAVFRALPDLLFRTDARGVLVDYSAGRASDLYVSPEAFLGKTFVEVLPAGAGEALDRAIARAHRDATIETIEYALEMPTGEESFEARVVPFIEGQTITVVRNVTERRLSQQALKRSEERLRESEKIEAIGRLAGGVAHDFNNLMMAVLTYGRLLERKLADDDPRRRDVVEICEAGERATRLTRQLLAFARRQLLRPTVLDCGAVVGEMEGTLRGLLGAPIAPGATPPSPRDSASQAPLALSLTCAAGLFRVCVDRGQLEQVVLNLVVNARDAMPDGGEVRIAVENATVRADEARRLELPRAGDYVRLSVRDTGAGIDADVLPHVFEPFYTTKAPGLGTGLGLSTVYGIVRQSGGSVAVESTSAGACFSILLPRTEEALDPPPPRRRQDPPGGRETVLVVEDDAAVRRGVAETLRALGYRVLEAADGAAALEVVARQAVDLVLTDVVMPALGGAELGAQLLAAGATRALLFMSGHAAASLDGALVLEKPFDAMTLALRVREALDAARPNRAT